MSFRHISESKYEKQIEKAIDIAVFVNGNNCFTYKWHHAIDHDDLQLSMYTVLLHSSQMIIVITL